MENRNQYIGSSDIAVVMGISRWKSPLQLWAEKTGKVEPKDLSTNEAVELGVELEDFVAKKFERKSGFKVRRSPKHYVHKEHSFLRCQVDRLLEGTEQLLEVKTCSAWKAKEWNGEDIPQEYIAQVMFQLGITGRSVGYIAVLIGGQSFKYKRIEFDKEIFAKMVTQACQFWQMVQDGTPPMPNELDNDFLINLYPNSDETLQETEEMNERIAYLQEVKMHIKELETEKDELEAQVKGFIGDKLGLKSSKYIVKWTPRVSARIDTDALKHDGLYESYLKENKTRILSVKLNNGGQDD